MKSLAELKAIRDKVQSQMNLRDDDSGKTRIVVGLSLIHI